MSGHRHEALRGLRCITSRMSGRYLEDFAVGQTGRLRINKEQVSAFAAEFDPQPFHLDEEAAQNTIFKGLAASGWDTAALTRLLVESELKPAGGIVGAGFDEFRWPRPVRPGDELHIESEVLEVRASKPFACLLLALNGLTRWCVQRLLMTKADINPRVARLSSPWEEKEA
jgi:acyl dehydratase